MSLTKNIYSGIKSIQRGNLTILAGNTGANVTITAVNTAKTEVRYLGQTQVTATTDAALLQLINSTTLNATRNTANANAVTVGYEVTEWY